MAKKKRGKPEKLGMIGNVLYSEGDRGCVLAGCAYIEHCLDRILEKYFAAHSEANRELVENVLNLTNRNAQALIGSGWAKATTAFLFGVINQSTYELYNSIRVLRNEFAHTAGTVELNEEAVEPILAFLNEKERGHLDSDLEIHRTGEPYPPPILCTEARTKFMSACMCLAARLYLVADLIEPKHWIPGAIVYANWKHVDPETFAESKRQQQQ